jgi:hypothetical protein
MPKPDARIFQQQHYNAIAKDIRQLYNSTESLARRRALEDVALKFCDRFVVDNFEFDPVKFLNQCSPDEELYPLGELWNL